MDTYKTFNGLAVSSKYGICGLPIRVDSYKTCSFGCTYCFSNNRKVCEFRKELQIANLKFIEKHAAGLPESENILDKFICAGITWHCGGMSDPFQPCEEDLRITEQIVDICNRHRRHILFSTKSDTVYDANIRPDLHTFQLSVTNTSDNRLLEPNIPSFERRLDFYRRLKADGFKVGIRIQPCVPGISGIDILKAFSDADHFTIEGLKLVAQNKEANAKIMAALNLKPSDFTARGLLTLQPEIREKLYGPFIDWLEKHGKSFSVSDNDMRYLSNSSCCCGDALVHKATGFDTTAMIAKHGLLWTKEQVFAEMDCIGCRECKANHLVTSNRQYGCKTVEDFYNLHFEKKTYPASPLFQMVNRNS